jgi:hypothetical protein
MLPPPPPSPSPPFNAADEVSGKAEADVEILEGRRRAHGRGGDGERGAAAAAAIEDNLAVELDEKVRREARKIGTRSGTRP